MDRKRTRGRQKIAIQKITNEADCFATFSKRRLGLFKKASEICTLCSVDIGLMLFSPTGKPFSFFHPTMESVFNRYPFPNQQLDDIARRLSESYTRIRIVQLNETLDKLRDELEAEKERENQSTKNNMTSGWWSKPVEELTSEQIQQILTWLKDLQSQMTNYKNEWTSQASTLALLPYQDIPQSSYAFNGENGEGNGENNYQNGGF